MNCAGRPRFIYGIRMNIRSIRFHVYWASLLPVALNAANVFVDENTSGANGQTISSNAPFRSILQFNSSSGDHQFVGIQWSLSYHTGTSASSSPLNWSLYDGNGNLLEGGSFLNGGTGIKSGYAFQVVNFADSYPISGSTVSYFQFIFSTASTTGYDVKYSQPTAMTGAGGLSVSGVSVDQAISQSSLAVIVPEPTTASLAALGLTGVCWVSRRSRSKSARL